MQNRKRDHIQLAFESQIAAAYADNRFYYEPLLAAHPQAGSEPFQFLGKTMRVPLWVSSMTGGTQLAHTINHNLARACGEFGLGMGLGSCRVLLDDNSRWSDFDVRHFIGDEQPLFANIGIAQLEQLIEKKQVERIEELVQRLRADGIIIHINPLQEWLQAEGDLLKHPPLDTIRRFLEQTQMPVIVKEVGQGMGPESLAQLMRLPLAAIDFGAFGGTNFARLELMRNPDQLSRSMYEPLSHIGHSAASMVDYVNAIVESGNYQCKQVIVSGGVTSFLDGYYFIKKSKLPAIYAQASAFLRHAQNSYEELQHYVAYQIKGLQMARQYLKIN